MDNIFGIGLPEFILILVIAGMVMGPERIARTARSLGLLTARLQTISRSFFRQLNAELDSVDEDGQLKNTVEELNQLRRQVADLRNEVFSLATGTAAEGKQAVREIRNEVEHSIMPPSITAGMKSARQSPNNNDTPVHRPPALFPEEQGKAPTGASPNGAQEPAQPFTLPKRVEIPEDPD